MKKRFCIFILLILFLLSAYPVISHQGEEDYSVLSPFPYTQLQAVYYGLIAMGILVAAILLYHKKMNDMAKKTAYLLVVLAAGSVTLYLVATTLYLNINSVTKGPVHWHADYEIWVCDKKISLAEPSGMSNKQGTDLLHAHNDNRIHVEGVLLNMREGSLGAFFNAVQGSLSDDGMEIPSDDGLVSVHAGDSCNGQPARLYVFVNGRLISNPADYVVSPFEKVPPGDRIKFVFTEKLLNEINPDLE